MPSRAMSERDAPDSSGREPASPEPVSLEPAWPEQAFTGASLHWSKSRWNQSRRNQPRRSQPRRNQSRWNRLHRGPVWSEPEPEPESRESDLPEPVSPALVSPNWFRRTGFAQLACSRPVLAVAGFAPGPPAAVAHAVSPSPRRACGARDAGAGPSRAGATDRPHDDARPHRPLACVRPSAGSPTTSARDVARPLRPRARP